jgi:hypothetical protein
METQTPIAEKLIRLNDVPRLAWLPDRRAGSKLSVATLHRWVQKGSRGMKLRAIRCGGVLCTRESWLLDFFEGLASAPADADPQPTQRSPSRRARDHQAARERLARAGI